MKRQWYPNLNDIFRNPLVRLRLALIVGFVLVSLGTVGYVTLEHYGPLDALFMTVITLGSVGFEEVHPLHGAGKVFTIGLILVGLATATWILTTVIEVFVSEQTLHFLARRRMEKTVKALDKHYIVCGYGRIGQQIATGYAQTSVPHLVIERDPARVGLLSERGIPYVEGDAADDDVLRRAGIDRALALIAVTPTDASNTFIVLSARGLRPDLFIVARADNVQNEAKLLRAGASKVVSPHILGGRWMGITAINPAVTDFVAAITDADHRQFGLREYLLDPSSPLVGQSFGAARLKEETGALVVAVRCAAPVHTFIPNPPDEMTLAPGDTLIALGSPAQLEKLGQRT